MGVPTPPIQDVVTAYLRRHPDEEELLRSLLDCIAAGQDVTRRTDFGRHVTTSGVVVNDADEVLLTTTAPRGDASNRAVIASRSTARCRTACGVRSPRMRP